MNPLSRVRSQLSSRASKLMNTPLGLTGRNGPLYPLGLVDRFRGPTNLADALEGKIVMVTGASSGIGEATARMLAPAGGELLLVARTAEKLEALAAEIEAAGGVAYAYPCDLSDMADIERMAAEVIERHGHVDVLVNNAGRSIRRSVKLSVDRFHDFERPMQLNYFGAIRLVLSLLPSMSDRRDGHVINISSAGVATRTPRFSGYVASKAALDAWSDVVAAEMYGTGIRFTTIHMPLVRTPMIAPTGIYKSFPALSPEEAADVIAEAIIHRPRRLTPAFGHLAAMSDAVSPRAMDLVRYRGFKLYPESKAAKASTEEPATTAEEETTTRAGAAFARATGGSHW